MKLLKRYDALPLSVRASLWYVVCNFVQKGISVITVPVFTRLLSKAEYGDLNVYNSWYTIIAIIVALGMSNGMHLQGLVKFSDKKDSFTSALQGLTLTLVIVWFIIYLPLRYFWNGLLTLNTVQMVALLVNVWTAAVFGLWANTQRVEYRYRALLVVTMISSVLKPAAEIFAVLNFDDRVTAKVVATSLVELLSFGWLFFMQVYKGKVFFSAQTWKYALAFCVPLLPHYLSQTLLNQADRIMIKKLLGQEEAAEYSLAYSVSLVMSILVSALGQSVSPWIYEKIKQKKEKEIGGTVYLLMIMLGVLSLLLIIFAPEVIAIFAPGSYSNGIYSIPPITIGIFFTFCYTVYTKFAFYYEKKSYVVLATVASAVINIVTNYIFIPIFGYAAAGYTTMACYMLYSLFHYMSMRKICREECDGRYPLENGKLIAIQGSFVVIGLIMSLVYRYLIIRYAIALILIIILYVNRKKVAELLRGLKGAGKEK